MATLQPLRTPAAYTQPNVIYFESRCHSDSENFFSFLTLPAYDPSSNAPAGLTLGVALDACQIAHCNEPGFLSTSTDRSDDAARTGTDRSTILTSSTYYYHLADSNALPTICSSFLVWTPPIAPQREDLSINIHADWFCDDRSATAPVINTANWTTLSERFKGTYDSCCLSGWRDCLTSAHLIPKVNLSWVCCFSCGSIPDTYQFREHCMERFAKEDEHEVNDVRNLVPLRGDLRIFGFDQAQFVFVPKNGCIVAHFIQRTSESANVYHNRVINTASTSPAYLYCRFAWAILHRVNRQTYPGCRAKLKIKVANSLRTVIGCLESTVNFTTGIGKIISDTSEMCMDVDSSIGEAVDDAMSFRTFLLY